jgi:hypothetical protein
MKPSFIGHELFCLIFSITLFTLLNEAKANRTRLKFMDNNVFLYTYRKSIYSYNIKTKEKKLLCESERLGEVFTDIFTNRGFSNINVIATGAYGLFGPYFVNLDESCANPTESRRLGCYIKNESDRLFISRDGNSLVTALTRENTDKPLLEYFDIASSIHKTFNHFKDHELRDVDLTDDGKIIALNFYKNGLLCVWFTQTDQFIQLKSGLGGDYFFDFALSPNGESIFSISSGGELWESQSGNCEFIFRWDKNENDLKVYRWVNGFDKNVYFCPYPCLSYMAKGEIRGTIKKAFFSENSNFLFLLINLEGSEKISPAWKLKIFDIKNVCFIKTISIENLNASPEEMAISPDGKTLIIVDKDADVIALPIGE